MRGMCKKTGKALSGIDHLRQSVEDILTTAPETRVMRREYGSELFNLVDAPMNALVRARMVAASAGALERWESRLQATRISFDTELVQEGRASVSVEGYYMPTGELVILEGIRI